MRLSRASCLALWLLACGGEKAGPKVVPAPNENAPPAQGEMQPRQPIASDAATMPAPPANSSTVEARFAAEGLELGPAPVDRWAKHARVDAFLGFAKDGRSYAVATKLGHEDEPGYWGFWVRFVEIRDVHTGLPIAVYQGEKLRHISKEDRENGAAPEDELEAEAYALMKTLPSFEEAKKALDALGMSANDASRRGPLDYSLEAKLEGRAPGRSRFRLKARKKGVDFVWSHLGTEGSERARRSPRIKLSASKADETHPLLGFRSKYTDADIIEQYNGDPLSLEGRVTSYWSPDGTRVALSVFEEVLGAHEEMGFIGRYDYYLRSVGPQIKLIDAGAGPERARKAAMLLDHLGMTVTALEADGSTKEGIQLYYRGTQGKRICDELKRRFPKATVEALSSSGWIDVIVLLGANS